MFMGHQKCSKWGIKRSYQWGFVFKNHFAVFLKRCPSRIYQVRWDILSSVFEHFFCIFMYTSEQLVVGMDVFPRFHLLRFFITFWSVFAIVVVGLDKSCVFFHHFLERVRDRSGRIRQKLCVFSSLFGACSRS